MNLQLYMSDAIRRIMAKAYRNVLSNPREAKTVFRLQNTFIKSEKRRQQVAQEAGVEVHFSLPSMASSAMTNSSNATNN